MIDASHRSAQRAGLLRRLASAWRMRGAGRALAADQRIVSGIITVIARPRVEGARWSILDARAGDPSIFVLGGSDGGAAAVLRIAHGPSPRRGLSRAAAALDALNAFGPAVGPDLAGIRIPVVIGRAEADDRSWLAETALAGVAGSSVLHDPTARRALLRGSAAAARSVAGLAPQTVVVGPPEIGRWVTDRMRAIEALLPAARAGAMGGPALAVNLGSLAAELTQTLAGRAMRLGWIHGDLWPANVLVDPVTGDISGLVDWDSAEAGEPVLQDLLHLALTTRRRVERRDLGALLVELLQGAPWAADDRLVLDSGASDRVPDSASDPDPAAFDGLDRKTALWLYWLRAVDINLVRHPELAADRRWVEANVLQVLACR